VCIYENRDASRGCGSVYAGDVGGGVGGVRKAVYVRERDHVADADGIGLSVNTWARNIDVVSAGGEILTGDITHCDVLIAGHDINQRISATDGRVAPTGWEAYERGVPVRL